MRSTPWMAVLVVLVFGLGWTAHGVNDRVGPSSWEGKDRSGRHEGGERRSRRSEGPSFGMGGGSWSDPFRGSISVFAEELGIDDDQRAQMDAVWSTLTRDVRGLEKNIWSLHGQAREDIHNLLTDQQKEQYTQLIKDSFTRMKEAKITRIEKWVQENTTLSEEDVAAVMAIYRASEEERARRMSFRGPPRPRSSESEEGSKDEGSRREGSREGSRDRDEKLLQYLSQQQIEELRHESRSMWGGRRP